MKSSNVIPQTADHSIILMVVGVSSINKNI